jgi:Na+/proline symporter
MAGYQRYLHRYTETKKAQNTTECLWMAMILCLWMAMILGMAHNVVTFKNGKSCNGVLAMI